MSYMKNLAIDQMNMKKPLYEVFILQPNGPDDYEWDIYSEHDSLSEATKQIIQLEGRGYSTKLFDPYMGKYYDKDGNEF